MSKTDKTPYPNPTRFAMPAETLLASAAYEDSPINSGTLLVFCSLDRYFDKKMSPALAFPSLATLGRRTGFSAETVSRHINLLHNAGFVKREYGCKIHGKSILDSFATIKPCSTYEQAFQKAKLFKEKWGVGATVCLLLYLPKEGNPSVDKLTKGGFLPRSPETPWGAADDIGGGTVDDGEDTLPFQKKEGRSKKSQQKENYRSTTTQKRQLRDEDSPHNIYEKIFKDGPWTDYLSSSADIKSLIELEFDEDIRFLTVTMNLRFLFEQKSLRQFEATRLREKLWFIEVPTVEDVNYVVFKMSYFGFRIPDELNGAVDIFSRQHEDGNLTASQGDRNAFVEQLRVATGYDIGAPLENGVPG